MLTKSKFRYSYRAYIFYVTVYFLMVLLNGISNSGQPYSFAMLYALYVLDYNIPLSLILFNISFIPQLNAGYLAVAAVVSGILTIPFIFYKILKKKPKSESIAFALLALIGYLFYSKQGDIISRAAVSGIITAFCAVCAVSLSAAVKKLFRCRLRLDELVSAAALYTALGIGFVNLFGADAYKALSLYIILMVCFVIKNPGAMLFAVSISLPLAIYYQSLNYVGLFCVYAFVILCFARYSKLLAVLAALLAEVCAAYYFRVYGAYSYYSLAAAGAGGAVFLLMPDALLNRLSKLGGAYRERHLVKNAINRSRTSVSNRLYEISNVFKELEGVFLSVKSSLIGEETAIKCVVSEVEKNVCGGCECKARCRRDEVLAGLYKLTKVGMSKGKVNLIDIPSDISSNCLRPNNILYAVNRLLTDYRTHLLEAKNCDEGRDMIARQAGGISEILKGLALETGRGLSFETELEKKLTKTLLSSGIVPFEILIYAGGGGVSVNAVLPPDIPSGLISKIVSDTVNRDMTISEKTAISEGKCAYMFKDTPPLDAVFGVAMAAKAGSAKSGDTYSVIRISEQKFLLALSDGMGSGEDAYDLSSSAVSLIEGFFKTGMSTDLVLSTVNKVLNFNREENYACLDIALIDLTNGDTGVIKIGSPFGFIIRNDEIKILENDSLPLGILDQLKPAIRREYLGEGDLLLLISDGISLAFGSSTDMFEFLKNCPSKNPQTLCDSVLKEAMRLYGGTAEDDMTVLATRLFKKTA